MSSNERKIIVDSGRIFPHYGLSTVSSTYHANYGTQYDRQYHGSRQYHPPDCLDGFLEEEGKHVGQCLHFIQEKL